MSVSNQIGPVCFSKNTNLLFSRTLFRIVAGFLIIKKWNFYCFTPWVCEALPLKSKDVDWESPVSLHGGVFACWEW